MTRKEDYQKNLGPRTDLDALMENRWVIVNFLNQLAFAPIGQTLDVIKSLGGSEEVGAELYQTARAVIDITK